MVNQSPSNKGVRFPSEALAPDEIAALLAACGSSRTGRRNRAALTLMHRGGMRCAEALGVRRQDFTVDDGVAVVRVLRPKGAGRGKKPRVVALGRASTAVLEDWLAVRDELGVNGIHPLCCTLRGTVVATSYMRELLPRLARKVGIERRVHPHALRHSFAFECVMEGRPLPWISKCLGHTSLLTTQAYLDHLAPADVISGMQERD